MAFIIGAAWMIISVWLESGIFEDGIWAGLLPATYLFVLGVFALSDPYFKED